MPCLLTRLLTRKGYGVQSPFAYHIVRHIIGERAPYYAYATLRKRFGQRSDEPLLRLLLRLSNALQPRTCTLLPSAGQEGKGDSNHKEEEALAAYLRAGCRRMNLLTPAAPPFPPSDLIVSSTAAPALQALNDGALNDSGCILLRRTKSDRRSWADILHHPRATLVFDCRTHALIFRKDNMAGARYHL